MPVVFPGGCLIAGISEITSAGIEGDNKNG